jgi:hypothetical protein
MINRWISRFLNDIEGLVTGVITIIFAVALAVAMIRLISAAVGLSNQADPAQAAIAKKKLFWSIISFVIVAILFVLFQMFFNQLF